MLSQKEKVPLKESVAKYNKQVEENKVKFDKNIDLWEKINKTLKCSPLENLALLKNHGLSQEDYEDIGDSWSQKDYSTLSSPWPPTSHF